MATTTTNLGLIKPELTDQITTSINNYNTDMDTIDTQITNLNNNKVSTSAIGNVANLSYTVVATW